MENVVDKEWGTCESSRPELTLDLPQALDNRSEVMYAQYQHGPSRRLLYRQEIVSSP